MKSFKRKITHFSQLLPTLERASDGGEITKVIINALPRGAANVYVYYKEKIKRLKSRSDYEY